MSGFEGLIKNNKRIIIELKMFNDYVVYVKNLIKKEQFFQDLIISLIQNRISTEGTDSNDKKLITDSAIFANSFGGGSYVYSPANKDKQNQNHVDLNMTGYMLNSMSVIVKPRSITMNVDIVSNKDSSVFENFKSSYKTAKDFKNIVFSLAKDEIDILNEHLLKRYILDVKKTFNYD